MAATQSDEQMLRQMQLALNEAESICNEFFSKESKRAHDDSQSAPFKDSCKIAPRQALSADEPLNTEHKDTRDFLFREEARIASELRDHFQERIDDVNTPLPQEGLLGDNVQKSIQQGVEFTTEDYELISKGLQDKFNNDVTRFASTNGLMGAEWATLTAGIDEHNAELLQEFYEEYGVPNPTELLMLSQFTRLPVFTIVQFCDELNNRTAHARSAEDSLTNKMLLAKLQDDGLLKDLQDLTRAHLESLEEEDADIEEDAEEEEVASMD